MPVYQPNLYENPTYEGLEIRSHIKLVSNSLSDFQESGVYIYILIPHNTTVLDLLLSPIVMDWLR